jgi:hypothetical protein
MRKPSAGSERWSKKKPAKKEPPSARGNSMPQGNRRENPGRTVPVAGQPPARGRYVYCIIRSNKPLKLGQSTIADEVADVYTVN